LAKLKSEQANKGRRLSTQRQKVDKKPTRGSIQTGKLGIKTTDKTDVWFRGQKKVHQVIKKRGGPSEFWTKHP